MRETSRKTMIRTVTTTRRFGPRFSIFSEFMAGRNSTPSSRLFMSWERREGRTVGRLFPKAGMEYITTQQPEAHLKTKNAAALRANLSISSSTATAGQTLKVSSLLFCTPNSFLSLLKGHELEQTQGQVHIPSVTTASHKPTSSKICLSR